MSMMDPSEQWETTDDEHSVQVYKQTCEACHKSKVKCSKEKPVCRRCAKTGRNCVYNRRKIRSPRSDGSESQCETCSVAEEETVLLPGFVLPNTLPQLKCSVLQNRITPTRNDLAWAIAEMFLETHGTKKSGTVHYDLIFHLRAYRASLLYHANLKDLYRLDQLFDDKLHLDLDTYFFKLTSYIEQRYPDGAAYSEETWEDFQQYKTIVHKVCEPSRNLSLPKGSGDLLKALAGDLKKTVPMILVKTDCARLKETCETEFAVFPNIAFRALFGISREELTERLSNSIAGYLPFGTSVMSLLLSSKKDLASFIEAQCIRAFAYLPKQPPILLEFPSTCVLKFNVMESLLATSTREVECTVTTVYRSLRDMNSMHEEVYIKIMPNERIEYLMSENDNALCE